jgi:Na+/H+ antiporter NhaC
MRRAEERTEKGERYWSESKPLRRSEEGGETESGVDLVWVPLAVLFATLFGLLAPEGFPFRQVPGATFRTALTAGYFFSGVSLLGLMSYRRVRSFGDSFDLYTSGMGKMMPVAVILVLAWSLSAVGREIGTAVYVVEVVRAGVPAVLVPALIFLVGAVMSFATGSSWGSFAIMFPLVIPLAHSLDLPLAISTGAVLGGGLFGDHSSPISDTTILSSTGAGCDHIDHVRTQLPYALAAAVASMVAYVVAGATASPWSLILAAALAGATILAFGRRPKIYSI